MARRIVFEWSGFEGRVPVELLDEDEPKVCEEIWQATESPLRMWTWHTTSTGDLYSSQARPLRHPVPLGTQAEPTLGKQGRPLLLCELEPGTIFYPGGLFFCFAYGPDNTEPLPARGPVFARTPQEHLKAFYDAGRHVWNAQYRTHRLVTLTVSREGALA